MKSLYLIIALSSVCIYSACRNTDDSAHKAKTTDNPSVHFDLNKIEAPELSQFIRKVSVVKLE